MDAQFWHERWQTGQIGFHEGRVNRMLAAHLDRLPVAPGARIFLPLCGKTRDIAWLREQGYRVAGVELSGLAIAQLFDEMELTPEVTPDGPLRRHAAGGVEVVEGDIFDLTSGALGPVDAVFDRAALVALPEEVRERYARHVAAITGNAPQLLVTFVYDPEEMAGPPFPVEGAEVNEIYGAAYRVEMLDDRDVPGGLKGICAARAQAWLLAPR
jgi:thiopurine S-methyltransferase